MHKFIVSSLLIADWGPITMCDWDTAIEECTVCGKKLVKRKGYAVSHNLLDRSRIYEFVCSEDCATTFILQNS